MGAVSMRMGSRLLALPTPISGGSMRTILRSSRRGVATSIVAILYATLALIATSVSFAQIQPPAARARGLVDVWVTLADPSVAQVGAQIAAASGEVSRGAMRRLDAGAKGTLKAHKQMLSGKQSNASAALAALGAQELVVRR